MAREHGGSLLSKMKNDIKKSGSSKSTFVFVKAGEKGRFRFLKDFEDGVKVTFHDSFEKSINVPCLKHFGKKCKHCNDNDLRTRDLYMWPVWNVDAKKQQILMYAPTQYTPLPALIGMFENYGTLLDRDYIIQRDGSKTETSYAVVPMDKAKMVKKVKPFTKESMMDMLAEAFLSDEKGTFKYDTSKDSSDDEDEDDDDSYDSSQDDEDDEEDTLKSKSKKNTKSKKKDEEDDDEDDSDDDSDEDDSLEDTLLSLSLKMLKKLSKELDCDLPDSASTQKKIVKILLDEFDEEDIEEALEEILD